MRLFSVFVQEKRAQGQIFSRRTFQRAEFQTGEQWRVPALRCIIGLHGLSEPVDKLACDGRSGAFPCPEEKSSVLRPCAAADFDCDTVELSGGHVHSFREFRKGNFLDVVELLAPAEHLFRIFHAEMRDFRMEPCHFSGA